MKKKNFAVFTSRLAHYLTTHGFDLVNKAVNTDNPKYYVYYFEDTPEIRNAIETYKVKMKKRREYEAQKSAS